MTKAADAMPMSLPQDFRAERSSDPLAKIALSPIFLVEQIVDVASGRDLLPVEQRLILEVDMAMSVPGYITIKGCGSHGV